MMLTPSLTRLETAELVRRLNDPDIAYLFKHALVQDTAYGSLLRNERKRLHRAVATALEQEYAGRLDEYAARLAQHYEAAGDAAKTLEYAVRAGDVAARIYASAEAVVYYSQALELATEGESLKRLFLKRGRQLELKSQFGAALDNYAAMQARAQELGDRVMELDAIIALCQLHCTPSEQFKPELGHQLAVQGMELASELGDRAAEAKILWILINLYRFTNRLDQARVVGEQSLEIARTLNSREQLAYTLNDLAHVYPFSGDLARGDAAIREATQLWRELDNLPMLADSLATNAYNLVYSGEHDRVLELTDEAYHISQTIGNLWGLSYSRSFVGIVYWARGDPAQGIAAMEESIRLSYEAGYIVPQILTRGDLALVYADLGVYARGIELGQAALDLAAQVAPGLVTSVVSQLVSVYLLAGDVADAARMLEATFPSRGLAPALFDWVWDNMDGQIAFARGEFGSALARGDAAVRRIRELGARYYLPDLLLLCARAAQGLEEHARARDLFREARDQAEALSARRVLWQIFAYWSKLEEQAGDAARAESLRAQAQPIVKYIAAHTPQEYRESFLRIADSN
jgi:hypothetical protein